MAKNSRNTKQKEIISKILSNRHGFFSAEDIFKKAKNEDKTLGIATVYRFLKELKKKGELHNYICDRRTLYSKEKINHCHFICDKTGKTIHFELDNLNFLKNIKQKLPGEITSFQLEIHGICDDCK